MSPQDLRNEVEKLYADWQQNSDHRVALVKLGRVIALTLIELIPPKVSLNTDFSTLNLIS